MERKSKLTIAITAAVLAVLALRGPQIPVQKADLHV
jgi:hypothetical protein